jgi:glyoxylase-like metal-dependent hydrolase (beta-lactamase superfamily II)
MSVDRRIALTAGVAALAAPLVTPAIVEANAPQVGRQAPGFFRFKVGDFEVTTLLDGVVPRELTPQFIPNVPLEEVIRQHEVQFMPARPAIGFFTQTVVNTGSRLILIDTGFNNNGPATTGMLAANMVAAGINPAQIDTVIISHFHPDHIQGLRTKEGQLVYPNAQIIAPQPDIDFYMDDARMNAAPEAGRGAFMVARRVFAPILSNVGRLTWGRETVPGITALQSDGHTPGHTTFVVSSGGKSVMVVGDAVNDPRLFARNPDWQLMFDMDRAKAIETRRRLLDMAAAERMQLIFYHAAFPATGFVTKTATGYDWTPAQYLPTVG